MSDVTECSGCGEPITAAGCERCRYDSEAAYLRAQLAAVEKERDRARNRADLANVELGEAKAALGHPDADVVENIVGLQEAIDGYSAMCAEQERRAEKAEKERDELRAEAARALRDASALTLETQTVGEAMQHMVGLCRLARQQRDEATGALATAMEALKKCVGQLRVVAVHNPDLFGSVRSLLASPAADLAARHDAEVTRRALEKAAQLVWSAEPTCDEDGPGESFRSLADRISKLATPTLERPR